MAKERYCACPYCEIIFKLPDEKLTHRAGIVRCGECREVFNPKDSLVIKSGDTFELVTATAIQPSIDSDATNRDDTNPFNISLSNEVKNPFKDSESSSAKYVDEGINEEGEMGDTKAGLGGRNEPIFELESIYEDGDEDEGDDFESNELLRRPEFEPRLSEPEFSSAETEDHEAIVESIQISDCSLDKISRNGVDDYISDRPNPLAAIVWLIITVGFVVLLGLQVKYFFVPKYAQHEDYRKYLVGFCKIASCELPPRRDAHRFALTHTQIDLHPTQPGALRVTVKLVNEATFAQPYPGLQLTLTDKVGRVVGRRTFSPEFYLPAGTPNMLENGALGEILFDLARPHEKAVGFVVDIVANSSSS